VQDPLNLLVTGGAGFIGSHLVHFLLSEDAAALGLKVNRVITLDLLTYAGNLANLPSDPRHVFIHGDILDGPRVADILRRYEIDAVLHLAAESHVDRSIAAPEAFITTNLVGTHRLLDQFRGYLAELGAVSVRKVFIHVSTDEVFGSLAELDAPFTETSLYAPSSPYSASKAGSDHLARAYFQTYGLPVIITNCSNNYGPAQFPEKLIPLMIRKTLRGEPLPVYGNGHHIRDWLYVTDHCRALVMTLLYGKIGHTYLIGGRAELKNIEVIHAIISTLHELAPTRGIPSAEEIITYVEDRPGHDLRYAINPTKIENELGWAPLESFKSGLSKTLVWHLEQAVL
jgi:dTDP-glucose 4,6-dehydratase